MLKDIFFLGGNCTTVIGEIEICFFLEDIELQGFCCYVKALCPYFTHTPNLCAKGIYQ